MKSNNCYLYCSDFAEQKECIEDPFKPTGIIECDIPKSGDVSTECCPASPTTVPVKSNRSNSSGSQIRSPKPRRQRTTSVNQNTINSNEAIIRSNNRTIYTAGRPPWYNCAGQQVEPFVIGKNLTMINFHSILIKLSLS